MPCNTRPAIITSKLRAKMLIRHPAMNRMSPAWMAGLRPIRSDSGPKTICPMLIPRNTAVMTNCTSLRCATPRSSPMAGSAGSIASIASATSEISSAISGTNSPVRRAGVAAGWLITEVAYLFWGATRQARPVRSRSRSHLSGCAIHGDPHRGHVVDAIDLAESVYGTNNCNSILLAGAITRTMRPPAKEGVPPFPEDAQEKKRTATNAVNRIPRATYSRLVNRASSCETAVFKSLFVT